MIQKQSLPLRIKHIVHLFVIGVLVAGFIFIKYQTRVVNQALIPYLGGVASLSRPLNLWKPLEQLPAEFYTIARQIVGHEHLGSYEITVSLHEKSAFQLIFELGDGTYHALEATNESGTLTLKEVTYEKESCIADRLLFKGAVKPGTVTIALESDSRYRYFFLNDTFMGMYRQTAEASLDFGFRIIQQPVEIHDISFELVQYKTQGDAIKKYRFAFGWFLLWNSQLWIFASIASGLLTFLGIIWIWLITKSSRLSSRSGLFVFELHVLLFALILAALPTVTGKSFILAGGITGLLLLWDSNLISRSYYRAFWRIRRSSLFTPLVLQIFFAVLNLILFREPIMQPLETDSVTPLNMDVNLGNSFLFQRAGDQGTTTFESGTLSFDAIWSPEAAMEVFVRSVHDSRYHVGFIGSSDPRLPCRFTKTEWEKLNHWSMPEAKIIPANQKVHIELQLLNDGIAVLLDNQLIGQTHNRPVGESVIGFCVIKGNVHLIESRCNQWKLVGHHMIHYRPLWKALGLPLLCLVTAAVLTFASSLRFRWVFTYCAWFLIPAQFVAILLEMSALNTSSKALSGWLGTSYIACLACYVFFLMVLTIARYQSFRKPGVIVILLGLSFLGFFEDYLSCWLPDRDLYMRDVYNFITRAPVPSTFEWYLIPALRYNNDYHKDLSIRLNHHSLQVRSGTVRIACVGGSTVACTDQQIQSRTDYPSLIQQRLNTIKDSDYEVMNGGVMGYTSVQSWYWFDSVIRKFHPDIVILSSVFNNMLSHSRVSQLNHLQRITADSGSWFSTLSYYLKTSRLTFLLRQLWIRNLNKRLPATLAVPPNDFELILSKFLDASRQDGFQLVFVREPTWEVYADENDPAYWIKTIREYYTTMENFAVRNGVPLVDPRNTFKPLPYEQLFTDFIHLTYYGNQLLADQIALTLTTLK